MPYENSQSTWSSGVVLTQDEDWFNEGPGTVSVTRTPMTGTADGGITLVPGTTCQFSAGDTVYHRANGDWFSLIWREVV